METTKEKGDLGENIATHFLENNGYTIIDRNYRKRYGEIDIIAIDRQSLYTVFIEVKLRNNTNNGHPIDAITTTKAENIRKTANDYLYKNNKLYTDVRFDVISILKGADGLYKIEHIKNAF